MFGTSAWSSHEKFQINFYDNRETPDIFTLVDAPQTNSQLNIGKLIRMPKIGQNVICTP